MHTLSAAVGTACALQLLASLHEPLCGRTQLLVQVTRLVTSAAARWTLVAIGATISLQALRSPSVMRVAAARRRGLTGMWRFLAGVTQVNAPFPAETDHAGVVLTRPTPVRPFGSMLCANRVRLRHLRSHQLQLGAGLLDPGGDHGRFRFLI